MINRYIDNSSGRQELRPFAIVRDIVIFIVLLSLLIAFWPLRTVPTGTRGVVTIGGKVDRVVDAKFAP